MLHPAPLPAWHRLWLAAAAWPHARSGIGDYVDEQDGHDITDYVLTVPAHELASTGQYLAVLGEYPAKFRAGERFCYCNSGYVVLALIAERVSGLPFPKLVLDQVCRLAGMGDTGVPALR